MPVTVRPARPSDEAAPLLYASAAGVYDLMFGGPEPALRALRRIYPSPGAAMSWEACLVAELDGSLAGVLAGYPLEEGAARARRFFLRGARLAPPTRWPAILRLVHAGGELTPPAPAGSWYVDALATAHAIWQVRSLDIDDPDRCLVLFKSNRDFGLLIFGATFLSSVLQATA